MLKIVVGHELGAKGGGLPISAERLVTVLQQNHGSIHKNYNTMPTVHLLDYVAGNVRSLVNAIEKLGWTVEWIRSPADVAKADVCYTINHSRTRLTKTAKS